MAKGNKNAIGNPAWVKGVSGNPNGRPKGAKSLTGVLADMMDANELELKVTIQKPDKEPEEKIFSIKADQSMKYAISLALVAKAIQGDMSAINCIFERIEGRVETRKPGESDEKDEWNSLTDDQKRAKIIELIPRVA